MKLTCTHCQKEFDRSWTCSKSKHPFCSHSCAAKYNNLGRPCSWKSPTAYCKHCGKECPRSDRKYCSNQCQSDYQNHLKLSDWRSGKDTGLDTNGTVRRPIRRYLIDKAGKKCTICGWAEINPTTGKVPLEVHHKDGNYKNNHEDNLQVLCPNCHALTPSYRGLNKSGGREVRRK